MSRATPGLTRGLYVCHLCFPNLCPPQAPIRGGSRVRRKPQAFLPTPTTLQQYAAMSDAHW